MLSGHSEFPNLSHNTGGTEYPAAEFWEPTHKWIKWNIGPLFITGSQILPSVIPNIKLKKGQWFGWHFKIALKHFK